MPADLLCFRSASKRNDRLSPRPPPPALSLFLFLSRSRVRALSLYLSFSLCIARAPSLSFPPSLPPFRSQRHNSNSRRHPRLSTRRPQRSPALAGHTRARPLPRWRHRRKPALGQHPPPHVPHHPRHVRRAAVASVGHVTGRGFVPGQRYPDTIRAVRAPWYYRALSGGGSCRG